MIVSSRKEVNLYLTISPTLERNTDLKTKFYLNYANECTVSKTFKKTNK